MKNYWQKRQEYLRECRERAAQVRREIRQAMGTKAGLWTPQAVCEALPHLETRVVLRELRFLAHNRNSNVCHNNKRGKASMYELGLLLEPLEE